MDFDFLGETFVLLVSGVPLLLNLAFFSITAGAVLAVVLALMRLSGHPLLDRAAQGYVFVFRGTPLLVQIFLIYYGLGQFPEVRESFAWPFLRQPYWCALLALTLNTAAYSSEIIRGGILSVPFGQIEAAHQKEKIVEAARKSGAHEIIENLPEGYETMLGRWFHGGQELSLGQWQKIALARAFMRDAEILVLDEPTASLDAQTEYEIFQRFQELTEGKMAILISHRFSTVRMADRIIVIDGGRIAEVGSHQELLHAEGIYAELFAMQAEGYR